MQPPSTASVALAVPLVVERTLLYLREAFECDHQSLEQDTRAAYPALCTATQVSPAFRDAAQAVLCDRLVFVRGSAVRKWLESRVEDGTTKHKTHFLAFIDRLPFKPEEEVGEGAKWCFGDIGKVLHAVRGVKILAIGFDFQQSLPGDWLTGENLATLKYLSLNSPLNQTTHGRYHFHLHHLAVNDHALSYQLKRDWAPTFRSPLSSCLSSLHILDFKNFFDGPQHLIELLPAAPTVQQLSFATLPSIRSYWPLYIFASLCTSLQELRFWNLYGREPEVLLPFPTGPPSVFIRALVSPVGYAHPLVDQTRIVPLESAPVEVLARVIERKERPMRRLAIAMLKVPTGAKEADGRLSRACGLRGIQLELYSIRGELDDDEQKSILDVLIKQSESRLASKAAEKPSTTPVELERID
ncbi:hypothetical protein Rhopal_004443-T1 [Rhodotorula paludigena]|uniref:Proteophosphoglycan ppg4 n=1 Tax=Rhodotorula paludigena TaxID=86838 RepID=A0AAV5GPX9_9BASI|nr:hypothetical protein Rhopal_004443-T1 [Rhodotorula paludigena]